jgi:hypothetical protein
MLSRAFALVFALALAIAGLSQWVGSLYQEVSYTSRWKSDLPRSAAAAELAATVQHPNARALRGRIAAIDGDADRFETLYLESLRDAPASAYRWAEYAQARARLGHFDAAFELAVQQAQRRAPRSSATHQALADICWRFDPLLSPTQRELLHPSLQFTMQDLVQRGRLLDRIVRARRQGAFCAEYGQQFSGGRWCANIETQLAACAQPTRLKPWHQRWCRRVEALP